MPRGRPFEPGNAGRPRGSRNRATLMIEAVSEGEAETFVSRAKQLALDGDRFFLRFFLERLLPRERTVKFELRDIQKTEDAAAGIAQVLRQVADGRLTAKEGADVVAVINSMRQALDQADLEKRLEALEVAAAKVGSRS